MATSSIYANVKISDTPACLNLVKALEDSKNSGKIKIKFSHPVEKVPREKIKEYFK